MRFLFHNGEVVLEEPTEGAVTRYIRGYDLISSDSAAAKTYYHYTSDNLGSITHITDEDGNICNQYEYDAFGSFAIKEETIQNRFCYTGEQYDPITSQYYLRARFYNPVIGRFLNEDTYYGDGPNLYTYCHNNPVNYVDPSGHVCRRKFNKLRKLGLTAQEAFTFMKNAGSVNGIVDKGQLGEKLMDRIMEIRGYEKLPSKVGSNNGIDGIYVKRDPRTGKISKLVIGEAKFGNSRLGKTSMGRQMEQTWIEGNIRKMLNQINSTVVINAGKELNKYVIIDQKPYIAAIFRSRKTGNISIKYRQQAVGSYTIW